MKNNKVFKIAAVCLLLGWLSAAAAAFWWFQFQYVRKFDEAWVSFQGRDILATRLSPLNANALVVHYVDDSCPCSRFSAPHIQQLEETFSQNVEFITFNQLDTRDPRYAILRELPMPATPAVAIWSQNGQLAYFGPYSSGAVCGEGADFVAATLEKLALDENPHWINHEAIGCFCPRK